VANVESTHYCIGSVVGPHPFPMLVRDFQRIIGVEARQQLLDRTGALPDAVVACVGGGSNAMGLFHRFIGDESVALIGCEAGGDGVDTGRHAAPLTAGSPGVLHGARSYLMQDEDGQTLDTHSISAGLDYPGVGPEHALLRDSGRARYRAVSDTDAMAALELLAKTEGILCAIESAHAFAGALQWVAEQGRDDLTVIVNCSGRGDKDVDTAARFFGLVSQEDIQTASDVRAHEGEQP
jgi:tryptophan synthase beta chain